MSALRRRARGKSGKCSRTRRKRRGPARAWQRGLQSPGGKQRRATSGSNWSFSQHPCGRENTWRGTRKFGALSGSTGNIGRLKMVSSPRRAILGCGQIAARRLPGTRGRSLVRSTTTRGTSAGSARQHKRRASQTRRGNLLTQLPPVEKEI